MKKEAIEKATADLNPILISQIDFTFKDDEETLKKLYGLLYKIIPTFLRYFHRKTVYSARIPDNHKAGISGVRGRELITPVLLDFLSAFTD